jgi:hypothetical protein
MLSPEDLLDTTLEEVLRLETENYAASQKIRLRIRSLVNCRLADKITREEYVESRSIATRDADHCRQLHLMFRAEIVRRQHQAAVTRANGGHES